MYRALCMAIARKLLRLSVDSSSRTELFAHARMETPMIKWLLLGETQQGREVMFTVYKKDARTGAVKSKTSFGDRESATRYYYNALAVAVAGEDTLEMSAIDLYWPTR